jgi:hypothetical protein
VTFTGDKPGSCPTPSEFGVEAKGVNVSAGEGELADKAVNVEITMLLFVGVAGGVPQPSRIIRNTPTQRESCFFARVIFMVDRPSLALRCDG